MNYQSPSSDWLYANKTSNSSLNSLKLCFINTCDFYLWAMSHIKEPPGALKYLMVSYDSMKRFLCLANCKDFHHFQTWIKRLQDPMIWYSWLARYIANATLSQDEKLSFHSHVWLWVSCANFNSVCGPRSKFLPLVPPCLYQVQYRLKLYSALKLVLYYIYILMDLFGWTQGL